jgi:predicted MFS family arabinose efflux permease
MTATLQPEKMTTRRLGLILTPLLGAAVAFQLSASMLSPVLVTMERQLHASVVSVSLTNTMGFLAMAIFSLFVPRLSDIIGRKRTLLGLLAFLAVGSAVSALAPNVPVLMVGRIIMGVGGPVVQISLLMLRNEVHEPKRFNTMAGLIAAVNGGIAGVDVLVGGWIATNWGFRPVFWVIAGIAILAALLVSVLARNSQPTPNAHLDWTGVVLLAIALATATQGLTEAGDLSHANWALVGVLILIAVIAAVGFWWRQRQSPQPFIPRGAIKDRSSIALLLTSFMCLTAEFALINELVPALAQDKTYGFSLAADSTALVLLMPFALAGWLVGPWAGRAAAKWGLGNVLRVGLAGTLVVFVGLVIFGSHSLTILVIGMILAGVFYAGIANIMLNSLGIVLAPPESPGVLPGLNSSMLNLGAGVSFVIIPALQSAGKGSSGYLIGMIAGAVLMACALAVSFGIRNEPRVAAQP